MKSFDRRLAVLLIFISSAFMSFAQDNTDKYILVINSFHSESIKMDNVRSALEEKYEKDGFHVEVLSLKIPFAKSSAEVSEYVDMISAKYRNRPNLIVCIGDAGLVFCKDLFRTLWKNIPVVTLYGDKRIPASVDDLIMKRRKNKCNLVDKDRECAEIPMATILNSPIAYREIKMIRELQPKLNKLVIMSDKRYSNLIIVDSLCQAVKQFSPAIKVECLYSSDFTRLQILDKLSLYEPQKTAIVYISWPFYAGEKANVAKQRRIVDYMNVVSSAPLYNVIDVGLVQTGSSGGGCYVPWKSIKKRLLKLTDKALDGELTESGIYEEEGDVETFINYSHLKNHEIDTKLIPDDGIVYGAPPTFWQKYKWRSLVAIFILLSVTMLLIYREWFYRSSRMRRSKELDFLKSVLDKLPISVKVLDADHDLKFVLCNQYSETLMGTHADAQGNVNDIYCSIETLEEMDNENLDVLVTGKSLSGIKSYIMADGEELFMQRNKEIVYDTDGRRLLLCSAHDVTDLQKGRLQLQDLTEKLKLAMDNAKMLFWTLDLETEEFSENDTVLNFFNKYRDKNGKLNVNRYLDSVQPEKKKEFLGYIQRMSEKEISFVHLEQLVADDDKIQWFEHSMTIGQYDEFGDPVKLIGVTMDITERKIMENELIRAKNDAEASNRLKSAFLANMSHEIRTPLNAIVGFSNLVASTDNEEEKQQYLSIVKENNDQLLQLIGDILDLSKIEAGSMDYNIQDVDIFQLFKELEKSACFRNPNESVKINFDESSPQIIMKTDKNRIAQVVNNLINNAMKFTQEGNIVFGYTKVGEQVHFHVRDTGCGIPKDKLDMVFGRFVKLNSFVKGTGLGLSICESIVNHLGGTIGVNSEEQKGSDFWFNLPM